MTLDRVQNSFLDTDDNSLDVVTVDGVQARISPGGGSSAEQTLQLVYPNAFPVIGAGNAVGGDSQNGGGGIQYIAPSQVFAAGIVLDLAGIIAFFAASQLDGPGAFAMDIVVTVTDATGENSATADVTVDSETPTGGAFSLTGNGAAGTWDVTAGTDLSADGSVLSSAAGGAYTIVAAAVVYPN